MAGAVEQGFEETPPENNEPVFPEPIEVETEMFKAQAIGMFQLPGMKVLDVITTPGLAQLPKMIDLFMLSLNDQDMVDSALLLNFVELNEAVAQWVSKSMRFAPKVDFGLFEE